MKDTFLEFVNKQPNHEVCASKLLEIV